MLKNILPYVFSVMPSAVFALIRKGFSDRIPLNRALGVEIGTVDDGVGEAKLAFREELTNHIGTLHATAIFGVAEAASGAAMAGAFAADILNIRPLAVNSTIVFLKTTRSNITARAHLSRPSSEVRKELGDNGKCVFEVLVEVRDAQQVEVADVTVSWHVSLRK